MSTFKAYLVTPANGPREYLTVEGKAKARARELGGSFEETQLPATKAGLIPFLNDLARELADPAPATWAGPVPTPAPTPIRPEPVRPAPMTPTASTVVDWVLDSASQAEVEKLFEALGVRFGEALRARRVA